MYAQEIPYAVLTRLGWATGRKDSPMSDVYATYLCAESSAVLIRVAYAAYRMLLSVDSGALS